MKVTKKQILDIISRVDIPAIAEGYNSMSSAGNALASAAKRRFSKDYPEIDVTIDGREGWIVVDGKKAVNMSQASGSPLSLEDVVDKMKKTYLGHTIQEETKIKITRRQLRRIIRESYMKNSLKPISDELAEAGLSTAQVDAMEAEYKDFSSGDIMADDDAFDKIFNYYMDTEQMPYEYARGRDATPDEWILMHWKELESVGMGFYPQQG